MAKKDTNPQKDDIAPEFNRLFWLARKALLRSGAKADASEPNHQAALAFAKAHKWPWAEQLLEASNLDSKGDNTDALKLLDECEPSVPEPWRGLVHFVRGSALCQEGDYDESIKACRNALDDPHFDTPGNAWNNLGVALSAKGNHDEAIKAYRNAIDDPKYDTPGIAWNNLGVMLGENGDHDEAIKAFHNAIDDPKYDSPGNAWNNLGVAFRLKGDHGEAIKAYRKAIDDPNLDTPAKVWTNLGHAYDVAEKPEKAEEAFRSALASEDSDGSDHARARLGLQMLKAEMEPESLSSDDRAVAEKSTARASTEEIEDGLIAAIQKAGDTQYEKYSRKPHSERNNTLSILRGWSSAMTLLEGSERRWRGGGYFLKWRGYGIVIDPGFDFLRNFHDAGYHGGEIHAVVVSHNHPDHNSEVKDIDDLRYELYKRLAKAEESPIQPYVLLWDEDTSGATNFGYEEPRHQYDPVALPSGFPQPSNLLEHAAKIPMRITPFKVNHGSDVQHAMGMMLELLDENGEPALRIGYTGDTAYFEDLHTHLADCDILIAHISQPSIEELQEASKLKEIHLGYRGTARLLKECKPKLALIGEFWAGFTDLRIPLVKGLRKRSGVSSVLPAGLAMHLRLPSMDIECTECAKPTPFAGIKVAPPTDNYGDLAYLCPGCMIE